MVLKGVSNMEGLIVYTSCVAYIISIIFNALWYQDSPRTFKNLIKEGIKVKHVVILPWLLGYLTAYLFLKVINMDRVYKVWNCIIYPRPNKKEKIPTWTE